MGNDIGYGLEGLEGLDQSTLNWYRHTKAGFRILIVFHDL